MAKTGKKKARLRTGFPPNNNKKNYENSNANRIGGRRMRWTYNERSAARR